MLLDYHIHDELREAALITYVIQAIESVFDTPYNNYRIT